MLVVLPLLPPLAAAGSLPPGPGRSPDTPAPRDLLLLLLLLLGHQASPEGEQDLPQSHQQEPDPHWERGLLGGMRRREHIYSNGPSKSCM
jgi:hypothetical protein